jgi:hypothetical protein
MREACCLMGCSDEARQHAHQALDLAWEQKEREGEARALLQRGIVYAHVAPVDPYKDDLHYKQALVLADKLDVRPLVAHCHWISARCMLRLARWHRLAWNSRPPLRCTGRWR